MCCDNWTYSVVRPVYTTGGSINLTSNNDNQALTAKKEESKKILMSWREVQLSKILQAPLCIKAVQC